MGIVQPIDESNREFVGTLAKGLSVIRAFGKDSPAMSVSQVAKLTDMTRAAARRFLLTLHALGYVECDGRSYRLAAKTLELGYSFLSSHSWLSVVSPLLEMLKAELGESVSLTVLESVDVVYLVRFPANRVMTLSMEVGSRRPAYCTAMGRALLGELPEAEARRILDASDLKTHTPRTVTDKEALMEEFRKAHRMGYATIDQELEDGLVAVSVPLRDAKGAVLAAANVCGHSSYLTVGDLETRCLPALRDCVARISRSLVWPSAL
jgi:IclR family transcriptional regulator, pca regulon regulatory protein